MLLASWPGSLASGEEVNRSREVRLATWRRQGKARGGGRARGRQWRMEGVGTEAGGVLLAFACVGGLQLHRSIHLDFSSQFTRLRQIIRAEAESCGGGRVRTPAPARLSRTRPVAAGFPGPERAARRQLAWRSRELPTLSGLGIETRDENFFPSPTKRRSIVRFRRNV